MKRAQSLEAASPAGASLQSGPIPALVEKARQGHPQAWEEPVTRFGGILAATGHRRAPGDIALLQQATWVRLVENLHRIEQPELG